MVGIISEPEFEWHTWVMGCVKMTLGEERTADRSPLHSIKDDRHKLNSHHLVRVNVKRTDHCRVFLLFLVQTIVLSDRLA